jgi:ATP-dependent exoDNAse (exonuclease V) beta subunit
VSDEQQDRIRDRVLKGGLIISAGAGTGKTYTLIGSYHAAADKLRKDGVQRVYDRILAITFTNAATYEFKKRVQEKVVTNKAELESYLTSQEISTIHSACQRMLQNLALEVGLNPSTEVFEEDEDFNLASQVLESIVREALVKPDAEVLDLLSRYDLRGSRFSSGLRDLLFTFHSKTRSLGWNIDTSVKNCRDALDSFEQGLSVSPSVLSKWLEAQHLIRDAGESGTATLTMQEILKVSKEFLTLYEKYAKEFDRRKKVSGWVSHDDSLYYAYEALQNLPNKDLIREYYRLKYEMLLVDEYQDTDRLQAKIIEQIARPERIYRVGDVKQSIFRFRRADPSIFQARVSTADRTKGEIESLVENRRSRAELVRFTNYLFSRIFDPAFLEGNGLGNVPFEPLQSKRDRAEREKELDPHNPVEVYKIGSARVRDMCADEATFIARRVLQLVNSFPVYRKEDNEASIDSCKYSDIAILLRTKTHLEVYLDELRRNNIPYVMADAPGFFGQQELGLIIGFLRFLNQPTDRLLQATLLRSPVFCISDETLLKLAQNSYKLNDEFISGISNADDASGLRRFLEMNKQLQNVKSLPKRDLIGEILQRTNLDLIFLTKVNGSQAYANLMKFQDMAGGFDKEINGSLDAFLNWVDDLQETTEQSQAQVYDEASDAVKIFTIHKAKGLEFPIVFVPMMFREFREFPYYLYVSEGSELDLPSKGRTKIPFLMKPGDTGVAGPRPGLRGRVIDGLFDKLTGSEFTEDVNEEWRLLYVAFTRAKDLLIFSICDENASETLKRHTNKQGIDLKAIAREDWNTRLAMLVKPGSPDEEPPADVARVTWHRQAPEASKLTIASKSLEIPTTKSIEQKQALPRLSATDFADYEYCPRRYYYAKVLGLRQYERHTGEEEGDRSSQEEGSKLHAMLEAYDFVAHKLPVTPRLSDKEKEKLMPLVESIAKSDLGTTIASTSQNDQRREFEFSTMVDGVQFISRIDLALKGSGGDWSIFDYKSGKKTKWSLELYRKQVGFYAALFGHAMSVPVSSCAIAYTGVPKPDVIPFKPEITIEQIKATVSEIEKSNFEARHEPDKCYACPYSGSGRSRWVCRFGWDHVKEMRSRSVEKAP